MASSVGLAPTVVVTETVPGKVQKNLMHFLCKRIRFALNHFFNFLVVFIEESSCSWFNEGGNFPRRLLCNVNS